MASLMDYDKYLGLKEDVVKKYIVRDIVEGGAVKDAIVASFIDRMKIDDPYFGVNKKTITIHENLSFDDEQSLLRNYPEFNLKFSKRDYVSHSYCSASRKLEFEILMRKIGIDFGRYNDDKPIVSDIGGNFPSHYMHNREYIHSISPIIDSYDDHRFTTRVSCIDKYNLQNKKISRYQMSIRDRLLDPVSDVESPYLCFNTCQKCKFQTPYAIMLHSNYDISLPHLATAMKNKGIRELYGSFIWDPVILLNRSGYLKNIGVHYEYDDSKIKFSFENDSSYQYEHDMVNYLSYIFTTQFYSCDTTVKYYLELLENRNGIQFYKITRSYKNSSGKLTRKIWFNTDKKTIIRYPSIESITDVDLNWSDLFNVLIGNLHSGDGAYLDNLKNVKYNQFIVSTDLVEKGIEYALRVHPDKFRPSEIYSFLQSHNRRWYIGGTEVASKTDLEDPTQLFITANIIYLYIYISKYDIGKFVQRAIKDIDADRKLIGMSVLKKFFFSPTYDAESEIASLDYRTSFRKFLHTKLYNDNRKRHMDYKKTIMKHFRFIDVGDGLVEKFLDVFNTVFGNNKANMDMFKNNVEGYDYKSMIRYYARNHKCGEEQLLDAEIIFTDDIIKCVDLTGTSSNKIESAIISGANCSTYNTYTYNGYNYKSVNLESRRCYFDSVLYFCKIKTSQDDLVCMLKDLVTKEIIPYDDYYREFFDKYSEYPLADLKIFDYLSVLYGISIIIHSEVYRTYLRFGVGIDEIHLLHTGNHVQPMICDRLDVNIRIRYSHSEHCRYIDGRADVIEVAGGDGEFDVAAEVLVEENSDSDSGSGAIDTRSRDLSASTDSHRDTAIGGEVEVNAINSIESIRDRIEIDAACSIESVPTEDVFVDVTESGDLPDVIECDVDPMLSEIECYNRRDEFAVISDYEKLVSSCRQSDCGFADYYAKFKMDTTKLADSGCYINRCGYILQEIQCVFKIELTRRKVLDMCGAPGGFLQHISKYTLDVISFSKYSESPYDSMFVGSGVVRNLDVNSVLRFPSKFDVITADGTASNSFLDEKLFISQLTQARRFLIDGGTLIIRYSKYYNFDVSSINDFEKIYIYKPMCSDLSDAVVYLVCLNYGCIGVTYYDAFSDRITAIQNLDTKVCDLDEIERFSKAKSTYEAFSVMVRRDVKFILGVYCAFLKFYGDVVDLDEYEVAEEVVIIGNVIITASTSVKADIYITAVDIGIVGKSCTLIKYNGDVYAVHSDLPKSFDTYRNLFSTYFERISSVDGSCCEELDDLLQSLSSDTNVVSIEHPDVRTLLTVTNVNKTIFEYHGSSSSCSINIESGVVYFVSKSGTNIFSAEDCLTKFLSLLRLYSQTEFTEISTYSYEYNAYVNVNVNKLNRLNYVHSKIPTDITITFETSLVPAARDNGNKEYTFYVRVDGDNDSLIYHNVVYKNLCDHIVSSALVIYDEKIFDSHVVIAMVSKLSVVVNLFQSFNNNLLSDGIVVSTVLRDTRLKYDFAIDEIRKLWRRSEVMVCDNLNNYYLQYVSKRCLSFDNTTIGVIDIHYGNFIIPPTKILNYECCYDGKKVVKLNYENNRYFADTDSRYVMVSRDTVFMSGKLLYDSTADVSTNYSVEVRVVSGAPGCGKSTYILDNMSLTGEVVTDIVLTSTKEASLDLINRAKKKVDVSENVLRRTFRTGDSYLINSSDVCSVLWVDEAFMEHPGKILLYAAKSKCNKIILLGDQAQIPFINRDRQFRVQFSNYNLYGFKTEYKSHSYRCPRDVISLVNYMKMYSFKVLGSNPVEHSLNTVSLQSYNDIKADKNSQILVFTQGEKMDLVKHSKFRDISINTIHEYQGNQREDIVLVRTQTKPMDIFNSRNHILVSLTRHTKSLVYYTCVKDVTYELITVAKTLDIGEFYRSKIRVGNSVDRSPTDLVSFEFGSGSLASDEVCVRSGLASDEVCVRSGLGSVIEGHGSSGSNVGRHGSHGSNIGRHGSRGSNIERHGSRGFENHVCDSNERHGLRGSNVGFESGDSGSDVTRDGHELFGSDFGSRDARDGVVNIGWETIYQPALGLCEISASKLARGIVFSNVERSCLSARHVTTFVNESIYRVDYNIAPVIPLDYHYLQDVHDRVFPGNSLYDRSEESYIIEHEDVEVPICDFTMRWLAKTQNVSEGCYLKPVIRTAIQPKVDITPQQTIQAFAARNGGAPLFETPVFEKQLIDDMISRFENVYIEDKEIYGQYMFDEVGVNFVDIEKWFGTQPGMTKAILESKSTVLDDYDMNVFMFSLKRNAKPGLDSNAINKILSPQTIACHDKLVNCLWSPLIQTIQHRLVSVMNKRFVIFNGMSVEEFENILSSRMPPSLLRNYNYVSENDASKFDKSQLLRILKFEARIMRKLGLSQDMVSWWVWSRVMSFLINFTTGFRGTVEYQRKSGDAMTLFGNTLVIMGVFAYLLDLSDAYGVFCGDDSYIWSRKYTRTNDIFESFSMLFNLEMKIILKKTPYFCSKFLIAYDDLQWRFVADVMKVISKLGRLDLVNFEHVEQFRISYADNLRSYSDNQICVLAEINMIDRYGVNIDMQQTLSTIIWYLSSSENFSSLYYKPQYYVERKYTQLPNLDI